MSLSWILVLIAAGVLLLIVLLKVVVSSVRRRLARRLEQRVAGLTVLRQDGWANLFGQRSRRGQLRGNGALVLTEREILFLLAVPKREIRIPLASVSAIRHPRTFMGRSILRPLLEVAFRGEGGEEDAVAWAVREPERWGEHIDGARSRAAPSAEPA